MWNIVKHCEPITNRLNRSWSRASRSIFLDLCDTSLAGFIVATKLCHSWNEIVAPTFFLGYSHGFCDSSPQALASIYFLLAISLRWYLDIPSCQCASWAKDHGAGRISQCFGILTISVSALLRHQYHLVFAVGLLMLPTKMIWKHYDVCSQTISWSVLHLGNIEYPHDHMYFVCARVLLNA